MIEATEDLLKRDRDIITSWHPCILHSQKWWKGTRDKSGKYPSVWKFNGKWKSRMLAYFITASIRENCIFHASKSSESIARNHSSCDTLRFSPGIYNFASMYTRVAKEKESRREKESKRLFRKWIYFYPRAQTHRQRLRNWKLSHLSKMLCESTKVRIEQNRRLLSEIFSSISGNCR